MKPVVLKSLTHTASIALGIAVAAWIGSTIASETAKTAQAKGEKSSQASAGKSGAANRSETSKDQANSRFDNSLAGLRSQDFRDAWNAIGFRDLNRDARMRLQLQVLTDWAKIDPEAALQAALGSAWDGGYYGDGEVNHMLAIFDPIFQKNPVEMWDLIQSGKLGLGSALARDQWMGAVLRQNPLLVISGIESFTNDTQRQAVEVLLSMSQANPELREALLKKIASMPDDDTSRQLAQQFFNASPTTATPAEMRDRLARASTEGERTLVLQEFASSLRNADPATMKDEWSKLPADLQARAARALLWSPSGTRSATELMDLLMQNGDWDALNDKRASTQLNEYAKKANPVELANWAMNLPDRPETGQIFQRSMESYISSNNREAKVWIESLPSGDWRRDRALAQYSQNALWHRNDPALSAWALQNISDPKILAQANGLRGDWAKMTNYAGK